MLQELGHFENVSLFFCDKESYSKVVWFDEMIKKPDIFVSIWIIIN